VWNKDGWVISAKIMFLRDENHGGTKQRSNATRLLPAGLI